VRRPYFFFHVRYSLCNAFLGRDKALKIIILTLVYAFFCLNLDFYKIYLIIRIIFLHTFGMYLSITQYTYPFNTVFALTNKVTEDEFYFKKSSIFANSNSGLKLFSCLTSRDCCFYSIVCVL
jgi:hypothetical protein